MKMLSQSPTHPEYLINFLPCLANQSPISVSITPTRRRLRTEEIFRVIWTPGTWAMMKFRPFFLCWMAMTLIKRVEAEVMSEWTVKTPNKTTPPWTWIDLHKFITLGNVRRVKNLVKDDDFCLWGLIIIFIMLLFPRSRQDWISWG